MKADKFPIKDAKNERAIPTVWRPILSNIVKSFVVYDYSMSTGLQNVAEVSVETAQHIQAYIEDYGEVLVELPEETWDSSIYIWMGTHWDVIIDLWTVSEGRSDLILSAKVSESDTDYLIDVSMVYVP